ncbi:MAG: lipoprotein [Treponemataceae bacterium]|nr:MAG: lipoprotein [Treponemataceae bacterium]
MSRVTAVCLFALLAVPLSAANWVLGAEAFSVPAGAAQAVVSAAGLIPQIMLDYFETNIERAILPDELTARYLHELLTRRQSLYLELSAAVQRRDKLIFDLPSGKKATLKTEDKAIAAVKQKIHENLLETQKLLDGAMLDETARYEKIALWKNDYTQLFSLGEGKKYDDALNAEKINGFLRGEIRAVDDYAAITAALRVYPGGGTAASVTEVGKLSESAEIARRLAFSLLPYLVQTLPIRISFDIQPESVHKNAVIYVDERVYTSIPDEIALQGGIHTVGIEAAGYRQESVTMNFAGGKTFIIRAQLSEQVTDTIALSLQRQIHGVFYINSFEAKPLETEDSDEGAPAAVIIEAKNSTVFGQFVHSDGNSSYFYVPAADSRQGIFGRARFSADSQSVTINPKSVDTGKKIATSRNIMYASYAAAMISLPVLFYSIGEYTQYRNGWVLAYNKQDFGKSDSLKKDAEKWETIQNVSIGVSAALTVNFVVQLIIYLVQANKVLPEEAKVK